VSAEMTEGRLRWVIAGFAFFVGVAYFVWLCALYVRFLDTNRAVREMAAEFYTRPEAAPEPAVDGEVIQESAEDA
jgi:hypothetical protein